MNPLADEHPSTAFEPAESTWSGAPLRIGVDVLGVRPGINGGGETYLRHLVAGLQRIDSPHEYFIYVTPRNRHVFQTSHPNFHTVVCPVPGGRFEVYQRIGWEWLALRWQARRHRLDVMHFPMNLIPPGFPVPAVLTVHDFSSQFYHENLPDARLPWTMRLMDAERIRSCGRAAWMVPNSEFTAREVLSRTAADPARIRTVHHIPREIEVPELRSARERVAAYGVREPFVLSVATLNPHKNLLRLLQAFAMESGAGGALARHSLVLVGGAGRGVEAKRIREQIASLGLDSRVVLTGYVPDEDVPSFYRAADFYVFPSLYEGFGLPMIEAAACGTPVAAANAGALPEVGADAALYFDPYDPGDIARAMAELAGSPTLRAELAERGKERSKLFSPDRTARETVRAYEAVGRGTR